MPFPLGVTDRSQIFLGVTTAEILSNSGVKKGGAGPFILRAF